jgi:hypothetical protein
MNTAPKAPRNIKKRGNGEGTIFKSQRRNRWVVACYDYKEAVEPAVTNLWSQEPQGQPGANAALVVGRISCHCYLHNECTK